MQHDSRIFVAGGYGLVGSAIYNNLIDNDYQNVIRISSKDLDLTNFVLTDRFFKDEKPEYVFLAAAKVGGILENKTKKAEIIFINLSIQTNVIHSSYKHGTKKLLFLGSSCIYPKDAGKHKLITEDMLLSDKLEPTNDAYAIAKIAGIKMCQSYNEQYGFNAISVMPTNLYGPKDNFDTNSGHVLPTFINRIFTAKQNNDKQIVCWGDGSPVREFLYSEDLAEACIMLMKIYDSPEIINIGTGKDISIKNLAELISEIVGYEGDIIWDSNKPNGTMKKTMNVDKINKLGWREKTSLRKGIKKTVEWYINQRKLGPL